MANSEHLEILKLGVEKWNVWREENADCSPDLQGANLSGDCLRGANLGGANLGGANLSGANLNGAILNEAELSEADIAKANLSDTDLSKATIIEANLTMAGLRRAELNGAALIGSELNGADLREAKLCGAHLNGAELSGADLTGADLAMARMGGANLRGAGLHGADLSGADLTNADLTRANLTIAKLRGADLSGADLNGADLSKADLSEAELNGANLCLAILHQANLSDANNLSDARGVLDSLYLSNAMGVPASLLLAWERKNPISEQPTQDEKLNYIDSLGTFEARMQTLVDGVFTNVDQRIESRISPIENNVGDLLSRVDERVQQVVDNKLRDLEEIKAQYKKFGEDLAGLTDKAPDIGIGRQAMEFEVLATSNEKESLVWLWITLGLLAIAAILSIADVGMNIFGSLPVPANPIPLVASKVILYSLLSFGVIWGSRNYRAEKHNMAVNKHRATALRTFPSLFESAHSEEFKEAILMYAAEAAYRDRPTGYDNKEADSKHVNPLLNEFAKAAAKTASGKVSGG